MTKVTESSNFVVQISKRKRERQTMNGKTASPRSDDDLDELEEKMKQVQVTPELLVQRAQLYEQKGQVHLALGDLRDALQLDPESKNALQLLKSWTQKRETVKEAVDVSSLVAKLLDDSQSLDEQLADLKAIRKYLGDQPDMAQRLSKDPTIMSKLLQKSSEYKTISQEFQLCLWECIHCLCSHGQDASIHLLQIFLREMDALDTLLAEPKKDIFPLIIDSLVLVCQQLPDNHHNVSNPILMRLMLVALKGPLGIQKQSLQGLIKALSTSSLAKEILSHEKFKDLIRLVGNYDNGIRSAITALIIRLSDLLPKEDQSSLETLLKEFTLKWIASGKLLDKTSGFRLLAALFHTQPGLASMLVKSERSELASVIETMDMEKEDVQLAILEALSAGCIDKDCRALFSLHCLPILASIADHNRNTELKRLATAILSKLVVADPQSGQGSVTTDELMEKCLSSLSVSESDSTAYLSSVEALVMLTSRSSRLKDKLTSQKDRLEKLISLAHKESSREPTLLFGICSILANLGAYATRLTAEEEQVRKLRKMAKDTALPSEEEQESDEKVAKRNIALVEAKAVPVLVKLATSSPSERLSECLSLIFLGLATDPKLRGRLVQEGSLKALKNLIHQKGVPEKTLKNSAHALAKILISVDPTMAFKGTEEALQYVNPLLSLCKDEKDGLCQFESLLALTNLSSIGPQIQSRIVASGGIPIFESLVLSDHHLIRRAATECLCNMMYEPSVYTLYVSEGKSQRLKLMVALSDTDDMPTNRAASGILAILSSTSEGCTALFREPRFIETVQSLIVSQNPELEHRSLEIIKNVSRFCPEKQKDMLEGNEKVLSVIRLRASSAGPLLNVSREILSLMSL